MRLGLCDAGYAWLSNDSKSRGIMKSFKARLRLICYAAAVVLTLLWTIPAAAANNSGGLSGTVTNTLNTPLGDVTVKISGPMAGTATTDAEGRFSFTGIPLGVYRVSISKNGFATVTDDHLAVAGPNTAMTVVLEPSANSSVRQLGRVVVTA